MEPTAYLTNEFLHTAPPGKVINIIIKKKHYKLSCIQNVEKRNYLLPAQTRNQTTITRVQSHVRNCTI